jgi:hypothetical protein
MAKSMYLFVDFAIKMNASLMAKSFLVLPTKGDIAVYGCASFEKWICFLK